MGHGRRSAGQQGLVSVKPAPVGLTTSWTVSAPSQGGGRRRLLGFRLLWLGLGRLLGVLQRLLDRLLLSRCDLNPDRPQRIVTRTRGVLMV